RPRLEEFLRGLKFGTVDVALDDLEAELIAHKCHNGIARNADENVVRRRRRDHLLALDDENVLAGAFRDVAALVEHDRLVKAVKVRLGLGEGGVSVDSGDFRPSRDAGVLYPPPG